MKNLVKIPSQKILRVLKTLRIYAILLPLVVSLGACSLAEALKPTPQIDEYGLDKNAPFACLVNGKKWEPGKGAAFQPSLSATYYESRPNQIGSQLFIGANNIQELSHTNLRIAVENFTTQKIYKVGNIEDKMKINFYDLSMYPSQSSLNFPNAFEGAVNITSFTTVTAGEAKYLKSVKGTFAFKILDHKGDTLNITAGRFNINY